MRAAPVVVRVSVMVVEVEVLAGTPRGASGAAAPSAAGTVLEVVADVVTLAASGVDEGSAADSVVEVVSALTGISEHPRPLCKQHQIFLSWDHASLPPAPSVLQS
mmetsp:Transcript_70141/g.197922  ORF Transcript_70141/g.197922 Transcript_70141/m.197922 type:complete len:105 (-) Transcript_70141:863-1177(-)